MKPTFQLIAILLFAFLVHRLQSAPKEPPLTDYQKAILGLRTKRIRAGLPSAKMLDVYIPTFKRKLGRYTTYRSELCPGFHGLTIIAKNGVLKSAIEWSCTFDHTYFDEMTADENEEYWRLWKDNQHVPFDRCIGRWGWQRPRMREWVPDKAAPGAVPKR